MLSIKSRQPRVYSRVTSKVSNDIYLSGEIGPAEDYIEELQTLREAQESDEVRIYINSSGGYVSTAVQLVNGIRNCKGHVTAVLEGECHSAATYIFLVCDSWEVNLGVLMLIHNYSGGAYGKGGDLVDNVKANDRWVRNIMAVAYEGFLTEEEIAQVNRNQDIWLETDEILRRLDLLSKVRQNLVEAHNDELRKQAIEHVKELTKNDKQDSEEVSGSSEGV